MPETGPELLSEILGRLFTSRGWGNQESRRRLEDAWREAVGPEIAEQTQLGGLRRGILEVQVRSPMLLQELAGFRKKELLTAMKDAVKNLRISDLRFRRG